MKKSSIILLQAVVVVLGLVALAFMLLEPHFEGRNVGATVFQVYFNDPFLVYAYTASIAFFVALFQTIKLLGYIGKDRTFSEESVKALRTIRYCATTIVVFVLGAELWLGIFMIGKDDITGGIFMGLLLIAGSGIVATVAKMFEEIVKDVLSGENNKKVL
jgi:hypothetical protein